MKFTNRGGKVEITAIEITDGIQVSVADNGIGIDKNDLKKLFDIGSGYTTRGTNNEKGTGLGLILCKEFAEKHRGRIWVESDKGKGSTFSLMIPDYQSDKA